MNELKAINEPIRHGDINFSITDRVSGKKKNVKRLVVAEGETPGHLHEITAGEGGSIAVFDNDVTYFEILDAPATLDHPEHGVITIEPGIYKNWRERERDPYLQSIRVVRD